MKLAKSTKKGLRKVGKKNDKSGNSSQIKRRRAASTPEGRENQLIGYAVDLVEQRLLNGTASSQEVTHFLKLGSSKARLEREKMLRENELLRAKTESIQSAKKIEELYQDAMKAMRDYRGEAYDEEGEEDDEEDDY